MNTNQEPLNEQALKAAVGEVMLTASDIEAALRRADATGDGLRELWASRADLWPADTEQHVRRVIRVRNIAGHEAHNLTARDLETFRRAAQSLLSALSSAEARMGEKVEAPAGATSFAAQFEESLRSAGQPAQATVNPYAWLLDDSIEKPPQPAPAKQSQFADKPEDGIFMRALNTVGRWTESDNAAVRAAGSVAGVGLAVGAVAVVVGGAVVAAKVVKDELS